MKSILKYAILLLLTNSYFTNAQVSTEIFESYKLLEKRELQIYVPEDYSEEKMYPLFVVLDAEYLFDAVTANAKFYRFWQEMPDAIVVGINQNFNDARYDDCAYSDQNGFPEEKGNQFFEFIGMELIPHLEKKYNIAPFKIAVGYDFTANFINYYLFKDNPLFGAYISLSPKLAPGMENKLAERLSGMDEKIFYYLASSSQDKKKDKQRVSLLNNNLQKIENNSLKYYYKNYESANHISVASYAIPQALDEIFKIFKPISPKEYRENILKLEGPVYDYLDEKYTTIEELFSFKKPVSLNDIMAIYAACLKKEDLPSLKRLAELGKKEFPKTMLGFYFMAEFYEKSGEPKKAMRTYEKAFGMDEIDFITKDMAIDKIDAIKADFGW